MSDKIEPTPYEDLPDDGSVVYEGRFGTIPISKELLYDAGWHNETGTTFMQRYMAQCLSQVTEKDDDE